jgi:hypothetical protein
MPTAATIADSAYSRVTKDLMLILARRPAAADCLKSAPDVITVMSRRPPTRQIANFPLWVGTAAVLDAPRSVCELGIAAVVCVAPELLPQQWPRDLTFVRTPLSDDGENAQDTLRRAVEIVSGLIADSVPTLIVCSMGHSRSIAVAAAAIAACEGAEPDEVLRRITTGQPADVSPALWNALKRVH